jgi:hypothetical protein
MSDRQIAQELECNFNVSGESVIHPDDLAKYLETACAPKYRTGFDRNYWIWEGAEENSTYMISADVARGDGQDNSAFHVFKLEDLEVVAEYVGKPTPDDFAQILHNVAHEYGNPMIVIENNNIGFAVLKKLKGILIYIIAPSQHTSLWTPSQPNGNLIQYLGLLPPLKHDL